MIYFIQCGTAAGPIKIGYAKHNALGRLAALQIGHYEDLHLLGCIEGDRKSEHPLHDKFRAHHIRGEWFHPSAELLAFIASAEKIPPVTIGTYIAHRAANASISFRRTFVPDPFSALDTKGK